MTRVLILGGPHDGEAHDVAECAHGRRFQLPVRPVERAADFRVDAPVPFTTSYRAAAYRVVQLRSGRDERFVAVPIEELDGRALQRLIAGYQPVKTAQDVSRARERGR